MFSIDGRQLSGLFQYPTTQPIIARFQRRITIPRECLKKGGVAGIKRVISPLYNELMNSQSFLPIQNTILDL